MSKEVMRQALEALESCSGAPHWSALQPALNALREALAEQPAQQEPVKWSIYEADGTHHNKPVVPDAIGPNEGELPAYAAGWNDCRALMLEMRKP